MTEAPRLEGWINTWNISSRPGKEAKGFLFISTIKQGDEIEEYFAHASDCLFPITADVRGKWVSFVPSVKRTGPKPVAEKVKLLDK